MVQSEKFQISRDPAVPSPVLRSISACGTALSPRWTHSCTEPFTSPFCWVCGAFVSLGHGVAVRNWIGGMAIPSTLPCGFSFWDLCVCHFKNCTQKVEKVKERAGDGSQQSTALSDLQLRGVTKRLLEREQGTTSRWDEPFELFVCAFGLIFTSVHCG